MIRARAGRGRNINSVTGRFNPVELFHLIDPRNFDALRECGVLRCASSLMNAEERAEHEKKKREADVTLITTGVVLRDQQPFSDKIVLCDGTTFPEYVQYINQHVFFWTSKVPDRFCNKYSHHIRLRCQFSDLATENPKTKILFSPYNSGSTPRKLNESPRCCCLFRGLTACRKKQPMKCLRGIESCPWFSGDKERDIVEIVVHGKVKLPRNTQYKNERGAWCAFFSDSDDEKARMMKNQSK